MSHRKGLCAQRRCRGRGHQSCINDGLNNPTEPSQIEIRQKSSLETLIRIVFRREQKIITRLQFF